MNPENKTTTGFPRKKENSIKLFLPTYDAKLEMFNRSLWLQGPRWYTIARMNMMV